MARRRLWGTGMLLLILLLTTCAAPAAEPTPQPETAVAGVLPLTTLAGDTVDLADFRGQVVLVNFWATWCAPCRAEMPELDSYLRAHQDDDFALLAVNAGEPAARASEFLAEFDFAFTVILDEAGDIDHYFGGVRGMPTTFVLDRNGKIAFQHVGGLTEAVLEEQVTPLLNKTNAAG